jgi:hypothetical protein
MGKFILGLLGGGMIFKLLDYLIAWRREKRDQKTIEVAQEKNRPRFRVDVSKGKTTHAVVPALVVKILSLGSLPIAINDGQIFIYTGKHPEGIKHQNLSNTQVSSVAPIVFEIPLPEKDVNHPGVREKSIQLVVKFSYGIQKERYEETKQVEIANWY